MNAMSSGSRGGKVAPIWKLSEVSPVRIGSMINLVLAETRWLSPVQKAQSDEPSSKRVAQYWQQRAVSSADT